MRNFYYSLLLLCYPLFSQNNNQNIKQLQSITFSVSGIVTDSETAEPLEYATISLKHKKLTDKIFGGVTDEFGKFSVDVNPGIYELIVDYISFIPFSDENLIVKDNTNIGNQWPPSELEGCPSTVSTGAVPNCLLVS